MIDPDECHVAHVCNKMIQDMCCQLLQKQKCCVVLVIRIILYGSTM